MEAVAGDVLSDVAEEGLGGEDAEAGGVDGSGEGAAGGEEEGEDEEEGDECRTSNAKERKNH